MEGLLKQIPKALKQKTGWPWTEEVDPACYQDRSNWPLITIVTPSYNQGEFIEETIRSVLLQNYPNIEYIIMDGNSRDNTLEVIKYYENWIDNWRSEPDQGQTDAINKGLSLAQGKWFNWLNSDDFLEPMALYHLGNHAGDQVHVLCGICQNIDDNYHKISEKASRLLKDEAQSIVELSGLLHQPGTYFRTDLMRRFPMHKALHYTMDLELWLKYLLAFRGDIQLAYINEVISNLRFYDASKSGQHEAAAYFWGDMYHSYAGLASHFGFEALASHLLKLSPRQLKQDYQLNLTESRYNAQEAYRIVQLFMKRMGMVRLKHGERTIALQHFDHFDPTVLPKDERKSYKRFYWGLRYARLLNPLMKLYTRFRKKS